MRNTAPINAEPPAAVLAESYLTATDAFYCRNHGDIPNIAPHQWRLTIEGTVDQPLSLTYEQLTAEFAAHDVVATLVCAGNRRAELLRIRPNPGKEPWGQGAISTATWRGTRLADVLRAAGARDEAESHAAFAAPDIAPEASPVQAYGSSIPLAKAMSDEVLLAWQMNGTTLPRLHGGPVRVLVPGFIGARSVKWIEQITVQPFPSQNYFQAVDYRLRPLGTEPAPGTGIPLSVLSLNCGILSPDDGATVAAGSLTVRGYAIAADSARVACVEVSLDSGNSWQPVELEPVGSHWAWRRWSLDIAVQAGPLRVIARAWDDTGATHPESPAPLWNPGGYGNNAWPRIDLTVARSMAATRGARLRRACDPR